MRLTSVPRRLVAVVPAILMVLASLGLAPTASAASSSNDISLAFEFEIHKNDTVDVTMITKGEDVGSSSSCDADNIKDSFGDDVKVNAKSGDGGNSCTVTIKGMTIKKFNNNTPAEITHDNKSKSFTFEMHASGFSSIDQVTVKVTFPGSVSKVSGDGKKSGRTATWENAHEETEALTAKGADHGSPLFMIIIIVVVLAAIGGGAAAFIIIRQKRAKAGAPGYPQPGQQPYAPQPGYGQPAQAPAPGATQPGSTLSPAHSSPTTPNRATTASRETVALRPRLVSPDRLTPLHPRLDASARAASAYRTFSPGVEAVDPWSAAPDQYSPGIFLRPRSPVG